MLRITGKDQLIDYCETLSHANNQILVSNWKIINFLTRCMINRFIKKINNISDDKNENEIETEILSTAFEFFTPFYGSLLNDDVYDGFNEIMFPIDYYRLSGKILEMIAIKYIGKNEIAAAINNFVFWHDDSAVKMFMVLFPVIENKYNEITAQKKEAAEARQDTYRVCFTLLQGTRQPESQFSTVTIDVLQEHILPDLLQEHIPPNLCAARSASLVSFFNNHLAPKNPENSWGFLSTIRRCIR